MTGDLFLVYIQSHVETLLFSEEEVNHVSLTRSLREESGDDEKSDSAALFSRISEFFSNILGLFSDGRNRHAVLASSVVMIAQYASYGINYPQYITNEHQAVFGHQHLCLSCNYRF